MEENPEETRTKKRSANQEKTQREKIVLLERFEQFMQPRAKKSLRYPEKTRMNPKENGFTRMT